MSKKYFEEIELEIVETNDIVATSPTAPEDSLPDDPI